MCVPLGLLRRYVVQSNLIEGITDLNGPHYASHYAAAKAIVKRPLSRPVMHPCAIHRVLSCGTEMAGFAGLVRECFVTVGRYATPLPEEIPALLSHWWERVIEADVSAHELPTEDKELLAKLCHYWFLWIHPFQDGNGRTSRLFMNMLRLRWELPWLVIENAEKWRYYAEISHFEKELFREWYPASIYPTDRFGRILDPKFPRQPRNLLAEYVDLPTGHVPRRCSIRSRRQE